MIKKYIYVSISEFSKFNDNTIKQKSKIQIYNSYLDIQKIYKSSKNTI